MRELLTCWGLSYLSDDAELIIAELVGNAVRHGLRAAPQIRQAERVALARSGSACSAGSAR